MLNKHKVFILSLLIFLVSISTVLVSYYISIVYNFIKPCIPNIEGCYSISRVGRNPPAIYIFKSGLIVVSFLIFYFYFLLRTDKKYSEIFFVFSILASLFLLLYIVFLGENNTYRFFRKIGIFFYIFLIIFSQFFLYLSYKNFVKNYFFYFGYYLSIVIILVSIICLPLMYAVSGEFSQLKNAISWNFFLLIKINFLIFGISYYKNTNEKYRKNIQESK